MSAANTQTNLDPASAIASLRAEVGNLLDQISQMKGMFSDADGTIAEAIEGAEETLDKTQELAPVKVVIEMDEGLLNLAFSNHDKVEIITADADTEGGDFDQFRLSHDGATVYVGGLVAERDDECIDYYDNFNSLQDEFQRGDSARLVRGFESDDWFNLLDHLGSIGLVMDVAATTAEVQFPGDDKRYTIPRDCLKKVEEID